MPARADIDKWGHYWREFRPSLTLDIYHKRVSEKIAEESRHYVQEKNRPVLLDVGCGQGHLSVLLAERMPVHILALDIMEAPLYACKKLVQEKGLESRINLVRASVYQLPFRDNTFDMAVSTGSESAATYSGAPEEVSRVVVGGGHMFIDFTRMPNLYQPVRSIQSYVRYLEARKGWKEGKESGNLHYGKLGLKERFEGRLGLRVEKIWNMNTSSLLGGRRLRLLFERTLGKVLSPLLARTILVALRNKNKDEKQEGLAR